MKKLIILILCAAALFLMAMPAMAAEPTQVKITADKSSASEGQEITFTVSITGSNEFTSVGLLLYYDSSALELVEQKVTITENVVIGTFEDNGRMAIAFSKAVTKPGKVATFKMKVKNGAALGSVTITGNLSVNNGSNAVDAEVVSCKVKVVCAHKYDNNCDATCNLCGETRKITHSWDKGKTTTKATCTEAGEKLYTCKVCGDTKTETIKKTGHKYDHNCDTTCNTCGETRKITHDYGKAWTTDENQHWHACTVCGEKKDVEDHTFTDVLSGAADGHGYACNGCGYLSQVQPHTFDNACDTECNDCGFERETEHDYSNKWFYDQNGHWHACTYCGDELEMVPHTPGDEATETTDQLCVDCGYIIQVAGNHQHTPVDTWATDENGHWFTCACGVTVDPETHSWDGGVMDMATSVITYRCTVCGYEKTEQYVPPTEPPETMPPETEPPVTEPAPTEPKLEPVEESEEFPLWIVFAALFGISLIANVILLISLIRKPRGGKYSE